MSVYSNAFAKYYDTLMGHDRTITDTVKKLVTSYAPKNKTVRLLELACGTGNILQEMPSAYQLFGLDIAESMLTIARGKIPHATLIKGDMANFNLFKKFDVILSVFDSINHLTTWKQWKSMFRHVYQHLDRNGIFIFDINTIRRMALLATFKPYVAKMDKNTAVFVKIHEKRKYLYSGQFIILEKIAGNNPTAIEEIIDEAVFPIADIEQELAKYFSIEKVIDPMRKRITNNTGRVFFICKKAIRKK